MNENIVVTVISSAIGLLLIVIGIVLLSGKGAFLVAGLNTMSEEERSKYNVKAICRVLGMAFLPIGIGIPLTEFGFSFGMKWLPGLWAIITAVVVFATVFYVNTSNKFKN